MIKFFSTAPKIISQLAFFLSLLIIIFHFYSISKGFYFTGDTISNFEPAYPGRKGDLLSVFIWSYASWPPGLAFIFNLLRFLPISFISQHQIYVILISLLNVLVVYLLAKRINQSKMWQTVMVAVFLFSGVQAFLFTTALSEPLLIFAWLATIYCLERFISTHQEKFLLLYVLVGSLIPLSRYSGIWVLLSFNIILIFYVLTTWKNKRYSPALIITSSVLAWIPILIYLIRNYISSKAFFSGIPILVDPKFKAFNNALMSFIPEVFIDNWAFFIGGLILGIQFKWSRQIKILLALAAFSVSFYYIGLALSITKFRGSDIFHSRYISVAYPQLMLLSVCIGSFLAGKILKFSKFFHLSLAILIFILLTQLVLSVDKYKQEISSPQSIVQGTEYSLDIRKFCLGKTPNKYLFLQESSLNWIGQALGFYCQPIHIISLNTETFELPDNAYLFTPYKLINPDFNLYVQYLGDKEIRMYRTSGNTTLNIKEELQRQVPLDWFSGAKFVVSQPEKELKQEEEWISYESADLNFSTRIPFTWHIYSVPQRGAVFLMSNIFRGDKENQADYYNISVQRITLESKNLEDLFSQDKFIVEKRNDYLIYTSYSLSTQDNILAIFISKDGKNYIRYSLAPFSKENLSKAQKRMFEDLNKIVNETKIF